MFEGSEKKEETESSNPRWWRQERKRERERETEQESYMQLELLQVYKHLVMSFVAQLIDAVSMHILNLHSKDACGLMARQQNNQQHPVITFLLRSRTTCLGHMQTAINIVMGKKQLEGGKLRRLLSLHERNPPLTETRIPG